MAQLKLQNKKKETKKQTKSVYMIIVNYNRYYEIKAILIFIYYLYACFCDFDVTWLILISWNNSIDLRAMHSEFDLGEMNDDRHTGLAFLAVGVDIQLCHWTWFACNALSYTPFTF